MHQLIAYGHASLVTAGTRLGRWRAERGQGTVEYVGLVLLVSLLMVGMVASMKGFTGKQGTELAEVIINKIKQAVNAIKFS
jgi:Flp pilus assembly pilin Flp